MAKRRVGIVVAELGIPSEVWILRQCEAFQEIEPVILYWKMHEGAAPLPAHLEVHQFASPFQREGSLARRVMRRVGIAAAVLPDRGQRDDIRNTVQAARVEGVLCHFAWAGLPVSCALGPDWPTIWHVHGRDVSSQLRNAAYRRAVARALPTLDHLVAVGRFQLELLRPLGLNPRHSVVPCGAPLSLFAQAELPSRAPGQPVRFISVGRLSNEKGVLQSLKAFELVAARHADAELVFIGGGPLADELASTVAASPHREKVRLLGLLPSERVAEELRAAHVYLQHSREVGGWVEGFGVTLTEAGAAGLPLVATRSGGIVDQVRDGENGLMFTPDDVETQAAHMLRLAQDETLRRSMGVKAREIARSFDSALMARRLEEIILTTLERRQG